MSRPPNPFFDFALLASRYLEAQLEPNHRACIRLIDEALVQGATVQEIHLKVIQPSQHEIGRLWEEGSISVAQEHLATAISQLAIAHVYRHMPRVPSNGKLAVIACVEGEMHDLGARIASDFLEMEGFDVRFLGANVPTESLLAMVLQRHPDLVALSVTVNKNLAAFREIAGVLRAKCGPALKIVAGGIAFAGDSVKSSSAGVVACAGDAAELVATARRLVGI